MGKWLATLCCTVIGAGVFGQNPTGMIIPPNSLVRDTSGQRDLIEIALKLTKIHIRNPKKVQGKRVYYSLLPLSTTVPGGGYALITATNAGFYLGDRRTTYLSNVTFSPSTNFRGQFNIPFYSNIWAPDNTWNFSGDLRFSVFPQYTWGLGGQPDKDKLLIRYEYFRLYQNALKRIRPDLFAGFGYNLDYHVNIHSMNDSAGLRQFSGYKYGTGSHDNSFSSGITFNLLYDTRNNAFNPLPGLYGNLVFRVNPRFMGSDDNWYSLYLDVRKYISFDMHRQNVLALWSYFWTTLGSNAPYLDLPAIGWDANQRSGRGFYSSRYTGRSLWDLEAEYRRSVTADELLGFVVFGNMNTVTEPDTHRFAYLHPAIGAGLRLKFNKHSGTNFGIDFGVSRDYNAVYFSLGEAF